MNADKDYIMQDFPDSGQLAEHLKGLSTYSRFIRFAEDFLAEMRANGKRGAETKIHYRIERVEGKNYFVLKLKDAAEFILTKDYTENWQSEMNEEFTFWSFKEHKQALQKAGFSVIENPNKPEEGSRAYTSKWITDNRFKGKVGLYKMENGTLEDMEYPVTNMILAGEKR